MYSKLSTPCFILDVKRLRNNVFSFEKALKHNFRKFVLSYSVKTNSLPSMLMMLKNFGCSAEVVSYNEYNLAVRCGFEKNKIIYNGPMKSKETFLDALKNEAYVNIETRRELSWLKEFDSEPCCGKKKIYNIGVRVNINLQRVSPDDAKKKENLSRFGFSYENGDLKDVLNIIEKMNYVNLKGLHFHRTAKSRSINLYRNICKFACLIIKDYKLDLDYIDIGGGFCSEEILESKVSINPKFEDYCSTIKEELEKECNLSNITLIVEPGNAIVASSMEFLSSVIDIKNIDNTDIAVIDGSRNDVDPIFVNSNYSYDFIVKNNCQEVSQSEKEESSLQIIAGCSCLEFDNLLKVKDNKKLRVGDMIKFNHVGAYTMTLSPLFIRYFPNVYVKNYKKNNEGNNDIDFRLIREEWDDKDYFKGTKMC